MLVLRLARLVRRVSVLALDERLRFELVLRVAPFVPELFRVVERVSADLRVLLRLDDFRLGAFEEVVFDRLRLGFRVPPLLERLVEALLDRLVDLRDFLRPGFGFSQDDAMRAS